MSIPRRAVIVASLAGAALAAGCAQRGGSMLPSAPLARQNLIAPDVNPPACKGQVKTKQFASLTVTLSNKAGSFCVPEFGGFGGTIEYPSANPPVKLKLISSTKDYNHEPQLGDGTAIFYLQLALSGATSFGSKVKAGGGLTAKQIVPGKPYTAYGQAVISGFKFDFGPCYAIATKGKYGGVIGGVGALLKGRSIPLAGSGVIEIYSGNQGGGKC